MKKWIIVLGVSGLLAAGVGFSAEQKKFNLVEVCKKDCPTAKTDDEAPKCADQMGRLNKAFKKSKCWEINEQYEAAQGDNEVSH